MEQGLPADRRPNRAGGFAVQARPGSREAFVSVLLIVPLLVLVLPVARILWTTWTGDYRFSHGPVALAASGYLLWRSRRVLLASDGCKVPGRWLLGGSALVATAALCFDGPTLLPVAWLGLLFGALGSVRGMAAVRAAAPAIGLLLFALPWPTLLLKGVTAGAQAATLQLTPWLAPIAGMTVERSGWTLTTEFGEGAAPYSVIVGPGCAGMKYLLALMSLAYFAAVARSMPWPHTLAATAAAIPLALAANCLRILLILAAGAAYGPLAGEWTHQNLGWVAFLLPCVVLGGLGRLTHQDL